MLTNLTVTRGKRSTSMLSSTSELTNTRLFLSNLDAVAAASWLEFFWLPSLIWYVNSSMLVFSRFPYSQFSHTQHLRVGHWGLWTCYVLKLNFETGLRRGFDVNTIDTRQAKGSKSTNESTDKVVSVFSRVSIFAVNMIRTHRTNG